MALRHTIHEQIRLRNLSSPWTASDLYKNAAIRKMFDEAILFAEPLDFSRSAPGLGLRDGKYSDDHFYYMRVGKRGEDLQFELCPQAIDSSILPEAAPKGWTVDKHAIYQDVLDHLFKYAKPRVNDVKARFADGTLINEDAWYQVSYMVLVKRGNPKTLEDFICVIAYAYSWLPTNRVAACPTQDLFKKLRVQVELFRKNKTIENRRNLVKSAQAAIGVSQSAVVTVSKVLHFWDPALVPMYDINVGRALQQLPGTSHTDWNDPTKAVSNYLAYWSLADDLIVCSENHRIGKLDYRKIDELLFQIGRRSRPPTESNKPRPPRNKGIGAGKKAASTTPPRPVKKTVLAQKVYLENRGTPKRDMVLLFVERVGLTVKGAQTYYQNLKKQYGD